MAVFPDTADDNLFLGDKHIKVTGNYILDATGQILLNGVVPGSGGGGSVSYPLLGQQLALPGTGISSTLSSFFPAANALYYFPFIVEIAVTTSRTQMEVVSGAGAFTARTGVFRIGSDMQPGDLVVDAGTISLATIGTKTSTFSTITLVPGIYLIAFICDSAAPEMRTYRYSVPKLGITNWGGFSQHTRAWIKTGQSTAAFPSNGTDWDTTLLGSAGFECMVVLGDVHPA